MDLIIRNQRPRIHLSGDTAKGRVLIGLARSKLAVMFDRIERNMGKNSTIGSQKYDLGGGSSITCSTCLGQHHIFIHVPEQVQPSLEAISVIPGRRPFPVIVSNEQSGAVYAWDGLNNKLMVPVTSMVGMVTAMAGRGYYAFSESVVTGTVAEDWNYWHVPATPACPLNTNYAYYTGVGAPAQKDQGIYVCAQYGSPPDYEMDHSTHLTRQGSSLVYGSGDGHNKWDYRYISAPSISSGDDVGMQAIKLKRFPDENDLTKGAEWTSLTGVAWSTSSYAYSEYGGLYLTIYPRNLFFYHSLFDVSLHSPAVYLLIETLPDASISMLDSWRDVYAGGFLLNTGSYAEQVAGGGPWMNRIFGMDSVGGVIETDNSVIVFEAASVIASLPLLYSWVSPAAGTFTITDDGTTHNDSDEIMADDETLLVSQILALTNQRRKEHGIPPLTINSKLTVAARAHAQWMANNDALSHTGAGGSSAADRINDAGYFDDLYAGSGTGTEENIAVGYVTAEDLMSITGWMDPAGPHITNILDEDFWDIGIAVAFRDEYWDWNGKKNLGKPYYVQDFGYRSDRKYKRLFRIWGHQKNPFIGLQKAVFDGINNYRTDNAVPALVENMALWRAANRTAQYGDGGMTLAERLTEANYDMWVDKDYITVSSHEIVVTGKNISSGTVIAAAIADAETISTDYTEMSVGYAEDAVVVILGNVENRWPGMAPICTTDMDLYHFTHSDPVPSTTQWVDSVPAPEDVKSYRLPKVYAV